LRWVLLIGKIFSFKFFGKLFELKSNISYKKASQTEWKFQKLFVM
jgi:hypothetical protein